MFYDFCVCFFLYFSFFFLIFDYLRKVFEGENGGWDIIVHEDGGDDDVDDSDDEDYGNFGLGLFNIIIFGWNIYAFYYISCGFSWLFYHQ